MVNGPIKTGKGGPGNGFIKGVPRHMVFINKFQAANAGIIQMIPELAKKLSPYVVVFGFEIVKKCVVYMPNMANSVASLFNAPEGNIFPTNKTQLQTTKRLGCTSGPIFCNNPTVASSCGFCCSCPHCAGLPSAFGQICECVGQSNATYRDALAKSKTTDEFIGVPFPGGGKFMLIVNMLPQ